MQGSYIHLSLDGHRLQDRYIVHPYKHATPYLLYSWHSWFDTIYTDTPKALSYVALPQDESKTEILVIVVVITHHKPFKWLGFCIAQCHMYAAGFMPLSNVAEWTVPKDSDQLHMWLYFLGSHNGLVVRQLNLQDGLQGKQTALLPPKCNMLCSVYRLSQRKSEEVVFLGL